jgi:hypothetical protein
MGAGAGAVPAAGLGAAGFLTTTFFFGAAFFLTGGFTGLGGGGSGVSSTTTGLGRNCVELGLMSIGSRLSESDW